MTGEFYRAISLAALLVGMAASPLVAQTADIDLKLEALPEIEVHVPSDRTDFTLIAPQLDIARPDLPDVVVHLPEPTSTPPLSTGTALVLDTPPMPPRLSGTPEPVITTDVAEPPPTPQIAMVPPPAPVVQPPAPAAPVLPAPAPAAPLDRSGFDTAFDSIWRIQPLPNGVMQGVKAYYDSAGASALWTDGSGLTARGRAVLATFDRGSEHGLDPARYGKLRQMIEAGNVETREIATSVLAALYARDARGGRINPQQVSRLITATPTLPDTDAVLASLRAATNPADVLEGFQPRHAGYLALKQQLAALRAAPPAPVAAVEDPEPPRKGRRRAVREVPNPEADLIANMERWRWLPTELGADHVFVNIPAYALTLVRGNAPALTTRVIVGKAVTQTPVFSDKMQFLVVNPYWNVPPSIALKEYLPLLQRNPYALQARGLEVISRGRVVDPSTVDWSKVGRTVAIRQPPGERNALGHVKFMFPNQHAVYLHDTPSRGLFSRDTRAFSHGCVRVENPFRLAEAVLGANWSEGRLKSMVGGPERQIPLDTHLPVHLAYFTSFVDGSGTLQSYPDIYGHNRRVRTLLGL